jgi:hypothetical protein
MFARYTVLFIGYSHSDVVVSYLGRGLRADSPRFVLTDDPDSLRWRRLGITPVAYPNPDGSHQAVAEAVRGWASWASMGLLEHRQRVAGLVATAPSRVPEEMSYLEAVIADRGTVGFFTEHARGPEWLAWAAAQREFQNLFDGAAEGSDCTRVLAFWFAERYVMEEGLSDEAWALVSGARGVLGPDLWNAIGFHLHSRPAAPPRPGWLSRWLVLMAQNAPRSSSVPWVEYALMKAAWPQERAAALLLFDYLTEPRAQLHPSFALPGGRVEVELRGDRWSLGEAWANVFVPRLAEAARDLIVVVDRQLRRAHAVLRAVGATRPGWDPMCFSRSAIEPHPQDDMPESTNLLIDAARDCLESLLARDPDAGVAYLHLWADADVPLLRRLAVHGWIQRTDVDASTKLSWLRSRRWLFDHQLHHEVFALIAATIPHATGPVADALVADAAVGPPGSEHQEHEAYNALARIAQHAPGLESARVALAEAQDRHPEYAEPSHPDLTGWVEVGWVRPQPPMGSGELHRLIQDNPAAAISELRRKTSQPGGGDWGDALDLISDTVRDWPSDGLAIFDASGGDQPDVLSAVVRGWGAASADNTDGPTIIDKLSRTDLSAIYRDVARMLSGSGQSQSATPVKWQEIPDARLLAAQIWALSADTSANQDAEDWLAQAINHPAGQLAQFWVNAVAADWQAAGDNWSGMPAATRDRLEAMLAGRGAGTEMVEVIFASQLHFFRAADFGWSLEHVLPLLDWADPARARRTWHGFLAWGRPDSQLLAAGLRDQYIQAATRAADFPDNLRRQLYGHLSAVALHTPDPATRGRARILTASVEVTVRVAWMDQIGWHLATLPAGAVEQHWRSWMQQYWEDRQASIPTQLTTEEATAMAPWAICLTESLEEGVRLATATPAGLAEHSLLLQKLTSERIDQAPSPIAKLVSHLLRGTQAPFYYCHEIQRIVHELTNGAEAEDLSTIREQALRLGCTDAPQW